MAVISRVETFLIPPRWLFVRIETEDGLVGWGEPVLEGSAEVVRTAVQQFAEYLVGKPADRIEDHWQVLSKSAYYRGDAILSSAVSGIDQALWDIAGKALGVPAHRLFGGAVRERIRVYSWVGGDEPSELADSIAAQVESGFTAVKMNANGRTALLSPVAEVDAILQRAQVARETLGPTRDLGLDFHGRFTPANARRVASQLEPLAPLFIEEPVLPEHVDRLASVVESTTIPIATGERLLSRAQFLPALRAGIAIAQPDLSHAGGLSEVRRIAALADTYGVLLAPHCPLGPIALASCLQLGFSTPNHLIQEQSIGIHYNRGNDVLDYLLDTSDLRITDGYIQLLTKPGLGIEIDESAVRAAARTPHAWRNPTWRHPDGSFAEW